MFYIEEILNVEKIGDSSCFDIEGHNITRHYFESKEEMVGFMLNNEFDFWNEYLHIDMDDLESNSHILPEFKFYEFDKVLVDVCKENGLSLDKLNGNEIEGTSISMWDIHYTIKENNDLISMEKFKVIFELEYLSSPSFLKIL